MRMLIAAALLAAGVPAVAQVAPPPGEMADGGERHGNPMFAGMSEAGRATMRAALRSADPRADKAATAAARDRMLAILEADRLDVPALRRAMDDEREAANAAKVRHQAALVAGLQQLSLADRRAFVANARAIRERIADRVGEGRMGGWQGRRGQGMAGPGMPPPQ
ncbi:MAG: periplasmic heavy metal sensor [Sphingomonadaceae bacterium]|nr:periplasmic heavy metal sensor [Sphingomonadaceae bacterium]